MANLPVEPKYDLYISKVHLPDGKDYYLKDLEARDLIESLSHIGFNFIRSTNAATTPSGVQWSNGGTVITGTLEPDETIKNIYLVPEANDDNVDVSKYIEYVCVIVGKDEHDADVYAWEAIGSTAAELDELGALAYAETATGSAKLNTVDSAAFANGTASVSASYTPAGTINVTLTQTDTAANLTKGDYTPAGSVSVSLSQTDTAANLTKADYTPEGTINVTLTQTGTAADISRADYTPAGSVSKPDVDVNDPTGEVYGKKTDGSVSAGSAASFTSGSFNGGSFTQGTDQYTAPSLTASVADGTETLTIAFNAGSFTQGTDNFTAATHGADTFQANTPTAVTLPTFEKKEFVTSVSAELHEAPAFTGTTETGLKVSGVSYDKASVNEKTFTGTKAANILVTGVNYDKAGVQSASFSGTTAENVLVTGVNYDKASVNEHTFSGTEATINSTGTAAGTINLTKTEKTITTTVSPDSGRHNN